MPTGFASAPDALLGAVADAGALFDADRLHAVRIAARSCDTPWSSPGRSASSRRAPLVRQLRERQEMLGQLHDTDVLRARVGGALDVPHPCTDLAAAHDEVAARLTAQERHLHARYLRRQASLIRVADKALDAIAPRVDQASARGALKRFGVQPPHARPRSPLSDSPRDCGRAWGQVARRPTPSADKGGRRSHEASGVRARGDGRHLRRDPHEPPGAHRGRPPTSWRMPTRPLHGSSSCRRSSPVAVRRTC